MEMLIAGKSIIKNNLLTLFAPIASNFFLQYQRAFSQRSLDNKGYDQPT